MIDMVVSAVSRTFFLIGLITVLTATYGALAVEALGPYACCGTSGSCQYLDSGQACPKGTGCDGGQYINCCPDACNSM
jgi:hypothetical protein